jgi:hypothetical protein
MTPQGSEQPVVQKDANISPCKKYRYRLTRTWDDRRLLPISMLYASQIHVGLKRRKTHSAQTTRPP